MKKISEEEAKKGGLIIDKRNGDTYMLWFNPVIYSNDVSHFSVYKTCPDTPKLILSVATFDSFYAIGKTDNFNPVASEYTEWHSLDDIVI